MSTAAPTAPAPSDPSPAPSPKLYTLAEIDAVSPFPCSVTWANLAVLIQEAAEVHVHFHAYDAADLRAEPNGRAMRVEKPLALGRALSGAVRHGNCELVRVYTMGPRTIVFGM